MECTGDLLPGRVQGFNLKALQHLVLDEADRLLNMDFEQEIDQILKVGAALSQTPAAPQCWTRWMDARGDHMTPDVSSTATSPTCATPYCDTLAERIALPRR